MATDVLLVACLADGALGSVRVYDLDVAGNGARLFASATLANPSFLALSPAGCLYAADETPDGSLAAFRLDLAAQRLAPLGSIATEGDFPCHITFDRTGRFAFVSNFGRRAAAAPSAQSVAVVPLGGDGRPLRAVSAVRHAGSGPAQPYQDGPHAHCAMVSPDNRFVLVADFGIDAIVSYCFDTATGHLGPTAGTCRMPPGSAPRTLVFSPDGAKVYASLELASALAWLTFDPATGALTLGGTSSTLPSGAAGPNYPAELRLSPDGRFAYLGNRGHDSIAVFALDDATPRLLACHPTGGSWPRCLALTPDGGHLVVANQKTGDIRLFAIDPASGLLAGGSEIARAPSPAFVGVARIP